jgi:hypothetical protein
MDINYRCKKLLNILHGGRQGLVGLVVTSALLNRLGGHQGLVGTGLVATKVLLNLMVVRVFLDLAWWSQGFCCN